MPKAEQGGDDCHVVPLARLFYFGSAECTQIVNNVPDDEK